MAVPNRLAKTSQFTTIRIKLPVGAGHETKLPIADSAKQTGDITSTRSFLSCEEAGPQESLSLDHS